jgi:flagellar biosynthesis protein FlhG
MNIQTPTRSDNNKQIPRHMERNIIAIASGKGGVGKTFFSSTLAHAMAKAGQKVLLFDGDLGLANVDVQLGLTVKRDLNNVVQGHIPLAQAVQHFERGGFDILAGRSGQASLSTLPLQRLNEILKQLRTLAQSYDAVLIDLGAGVDKNIRFLASAAGTNIIVTTEDPTALTDAYAFIKLANAAGHADTAHIVVNMADSERSGQRTIETLQRACENFLKLKPPALGIVRHDRHVREAVRFQTPLLTRSPHCDAAGDISDIAARVLARVHQL